MIVIAGYGFVGHAVANKFQKYMDIEIVDPKINNKTVADIADVKGVIICVNTPESSDGSCDYSHVVEVLETIDSTIPVIIKSAVDINGVMDIKKRFPDHEITYSPEFLRAKTADRDFATQDYVIFGGGDQDFWLDVWTQAFPYIAAHFITDIEASLVKYAENSFLATKVSFFNQLYDLCENVGADFESVRYSLCRDERIGPDHSYVTAERGWGGHCFPKDTRAMIKQSREAGAPMTILEQACIYNNQVRNG